MPPLAYFGIESSGLNLIIDLLILFAAVLYFSLIYWTYADARRRVADPIMIGLATFVSAGFPFLGAIIYLILRPPEYLDDVHERELETQAAEARVAELEQTRCPHCDGRVQPDFVRCPTCLRKLKERCANCSRPLEKVWTICPYCEAEVATAPPARRASRRRTTPATQQLSDERADLRPADADEEALPTRLAATEAARSPRGGRASRSEGRPRPSSS
jgi:hypothetical protein